MQRREFIRTSCIACAGTFVMSSFLAACKTSKHISKYTSENKKLTIKKSEFIMVRKGTQTTLKYVTLKPAELQFPMAIYKLNDTEYKTILLQCTHQSCELNAHESA